MEWDGLGGVAKHRVGILPEWFKTGLEKRCPFVWFAPRLGHSSHSIPYYSKPFHFLNSTNYSILFHFFSTFFFNFPNPYTISLNLNHLYHLKIHKVKPFNIFFFSNHSKLFSNHFAHPKTWNRMGKIVCPNKSLGLIVLVVVVID